MRRYGWGYPPPPLPGWGYPQLPPRRRQSGLAVLVTITVLAFLAVPYAHFVRPQVRIVRGVLAGQWPELPRPSFRLPQFSPARPGAGPAQPDPAPHGLSFTSAHGCDPARDWRSPSLDRRVRALLRAAAAHTSIRVSCLRSGHSRYVRGTTRVSNHTVWRAADIDVVDGRVVDAGNQAARQLAGWIGRGGAGVHPSEVGSPWDFGRRPFFTDERHRGHLHVGFAGPTQPGGR